MVHRVVGAADIPLSRKAQAALKKAQAAAPLNTTRGRDPTITVVEKPAEKDTFNDGRPDKAAYDTEQNALRAQIDALQAKSVRLSCCVGAATAGGVVKEEGNTMEWMSGRTAGMSSGCSGVPA